MTDRHSLPSHDPFELLADECRRALLTALEGRPEPVCLADLTSELAGTGRSLDAPLDGATRRERLRIHLHHVHLPKLASAGVVEYDRESNAVALTADGRALVEHLLSRFDDLESAVTLGSG